MTETTRKTQEEELNQAVDLLSMFLKRKMRLNGKSN